MRIDDDDIIQGEKAAMCHLQNRRIRIKVA